MRICGGRLAGLACVLLALSLISQPRAVAASPAAALGPEAAAGEPSGGYVGRLSVSPEHGPPGTPLAVIAEGLPAEQEFQLVWRTVNGAWKVTDAEYHGRDYNPVAYEIAKVKTDRAGRLSATFITPEDFGFMHDIMLQQGGRLFTQVGFAIDMTVEISPKSGPVGTPIAVEVKGIGWRPLFNSWDLLYDNNFTGWVSSVTTHGSASFSIPATGEPGVHILEVLHGELTFPYRNMQQSPEPDRPRWAIPFTVTAGAPVLPPPPEQQAQKNVRVPRPQVDLVATPQFSGVGEPAQVRGEGLEPGKSYRLHWTRVIGNRMTGAGWEQSSTSVAESKADGSGRAEFRFIVPDDLGGAHGLWIEAGSAKKTRRTGSSRLRFRLISAADRWALPSRSISTASAGRRPQTSTIWSTTTAISAMPAPSTARVMSRSSSKRPAHLPGISSISIPAFTRVSRHDRTTFVFRS